MADEPFDALWFRMIDGERYEKRVTPGQGPQVLVTATDWIAIDEELHIRAQNVVSVRLVTNAHETIFIA